MNGTATTPAIPKLPNDEIPFPEVHPPASLDPNTSKIPPNMVINTPVPLSSITIFGLSVNQLAMKAPSMALEI